MFLTKKNSITSATNSSMAHAFPIATDWDTQLLTIEMSVYWEFPWVPWVPGYSHGNGNRYASFMGMGIEIIIIIIITRLITHVKVIHRVKNRKCGWSRISEGKLGCKVQNGNDLMAMGGNEMNE